MFLDSLVGDAAWRCKYAISREGDRLPWALHEEEVRAKHPYEVLTLRGMLAVPYFEKALYEMDEAQLSAESIAALADTIDTQIQGGMAARPLLAVPHLLSDEASCYYHGYVSDASVRPSATGGTPRRPRARARSLLFWIAPT